MHTFVTTGCHGEWYDHAIAEAFLINQHGLCVNHRLSLTPSSPDLQHALRSHESGHRLPSERSLIPPISNHRSPSTAFDPARLLPPCQVVAFRKYFKDTAPFCVKGGQVKLEHVDPAYELLNHFMHGTQTIKHKFGSVTQVRPSAETLLAIVFR